MRKKKTYLQKTPCSKYLGITHYRAYLFTGNLNTIILPKERSNAVLEQFCNTEYNLQQIMQFGSRSYRHRVYGGNSHGFVNLVLLYEAKF